MSELAPVVFLDSFLVRLRPLEPSDAPLLFRWINDPEVRIFVTAFLPQTMSQEEEFIKKANDNNNVVLGIEEKETGEFIGVMGLHDISWVNRTATTGAIIGVKEKRGIGLGTDAKMALLRYAFKDLGLRKINSSVISFNERSRRYSEKCGYRFEGVKKKQFFKNGEYADEILLAVFAEDWDQVWEQYQLSKK